MGHFTINRRHLLGLLTMVLAVVWVGAASAETPPIVRVEEDWEVVIGTPDPTTSGPQVICTISPTGNVDSFHATLELNHHDIPSFAPGGVQFEIWQGDVALNERKFPDTSLLNIPGEIITWTQAMELADGELYFEIINGTSDPDTWGSFGGQGYLKGSVETTLTDLNQYDPEVSVANSGASYAGNRVQSLVLKKVRVYLSTGEMYEDTVPRVVHSSQ